MLPLCYYNYFTSIFITMTHIIIWWKHFGHTDHLFHMFAILIIRKYLIRGEWFFARFFCAYIASERSIWAKWLQKKKSTKRIGAYHWKIVVKLAHPLLLTISWSADWKRFYWIWGLVQMYAEARKCKPTHGGDTFTFHFFIISDERFVCHTLL